MPKANAIRRAMMEDGQSTLELALTLPVLLILLTGMVNFGMAIKNYEVLTDAVNVSARQLAISRGQTTDPCATGSGAVIQAAPNLNASNMTFTTTIAYGTGTYPYNGTSCSSPNTYTGAAGNLRFGGTVRLTVTYPYSIWWFSHNNSSYNLIASTSETVQ